MKMNLISKEKNFKRNLNVPSYEKIMSDSNSQNYLREQLTSIPLQFQFTGMVQYDQDNRDDGLKKNLYNCSKCTFSTRMSSRFQRHVKSVHQKIKDFKCNDCPYAASQEVNLTAHIKLAHTKNRKDFQ